MSETVVADLKSLHTAAIDARHGYEEALKDAEGHGMTPLFRDMISCTASTPTNWPPRSALRVLPRTTTARS